MLKIYEGYLNGLPHGTADHARLSSIISGTTASDTVLVAQQRLTTTALELIIAALINQ
jgi:hypothetical protein